MKIILATRNRSKIDQIKAVFNDQPFEILSLEDAGVSGDAVEDGQTLEENAFKKAFFAQQATGLWSIADDTGLFIDALGGKPGIHAGRWAGPGKTTEEIMNFTLGQLAGVGLPDRGATFKTVAVAVSPNSQKRAFLGEARGRLLEAPRTACQPHMPYSPIFQPIASDKVWAEMSVEEENKVSHRGQAFQKLKDFFLKMIS